ncbi:hypothetical protein [Sphingomonas sp. ATCC 31555]|uniref:hypothetical protein n=1 Tax=Sphingomonas sp. ATCC 31555 TaxID=194867 RepID=UPI001ED943A8|nr:hypothetical protein [Sphingomonas sp. ATCC 31555]
MAQHMPQLLSGDRHIVCRQQQRQRTKAGLSLLCHLIGRRMGGERTLQACLHLFAFHSGTSPPLAWMTSAMVKPIGKNSFNLLFLGGYT